MISDDDDDDVVDELYQRVDVPLKVGEDTEADGRKFLLCEHNRDGDSHRSPWSNSYFPPLDDYGLRPPERLRSLELHANEVFDVYRNLYYGKSSSVSSVYLWDKGGDNSAASATGGGTGGGGKGDGNNGFAGCFLVRNQMDDGNYWNGIHVVDAGRTTLKGKCTYKLTSTILISITPSSSSFSSSSYGEERQKKSSTTTSTSTTNNVSGSLVRHNVRTCTVDEESDHVANIGRIVEDVEGEMRSELDALYVQKTRSVVEMMRKECGARTMTQGKEHTKVLNDAVLAMAMERKARV